MHLWLGLKTMNETGKVEGMNDTSVAGGVATTVRSVNILRVKLFPITPPPFLCMLALGKTGEGAYSRDSDIYM